ncbi:hypothetical protein ACIBKY_12170 [Nonomuraea sp. NPDC050394]|uniref:hypothetical protein n=1 Tax=Nonomuraea sp. NPDC050394 TaxID=3364363 RepID=UPI0037928F3C
MIVNKIAILLVGAGVIIGLIPVSSGHVEVPCGSAFFASKMPRRLDLTNALQAAFGSRDLPTDNEARCADVRNTIRIPALLLIGGGVGIFVGGVITSRKRSATPPDNATD